MSAGPVQALRPFTWRFAGSRFPSFFTVPVFRFPFHPRRSSDGAAGACAVARPAVRSWRSAMALLLALCGGGETATAQGRPDLLPPTALKRMSMEELLEQEVVSVSRRPENWGQAASSVFVIRGEAARVSGATRLPQLLRLAPTLFVGQVNSANWGINARGLMRVEGVSNKMHVLIDGRSVYSPFFSNVFWDITDIFIPDLDRIEVISGPAGANWGSNAMNGVINVHTRPAHLTQGGLVYAGGGSMEEATFGVRYGGRFGETGAYRVYAKAAKFDASLNAEGRSDHLDDWSATQVGFRADWGQAGANEFSLHGDAVQGRFEAGTGPKTHADGANLAFRWSRDVTADANLLVRMYYDYARRDISQLYIANTHTSDLEVQFRFEPAEGQEIVVGGQYRSIHDNVSQAVNFSILPSRLNFELGSAFVQHEYRTPRRDVTVTSGVRLEHNYFSGWEYQPHFRAAWRPGEWQTFWAEVARTTRTPSRLETGFYFGEPGEYSIVGNRNFDSEVLVAGEVGWRALISTRLWLSSTLFRHEYDDLRSVEPGPPATQANGLRGRTQGLELFVDWDLKPWWRLRAGGFLMDQEVWRKPGSLDVEGAAGETSFPEHQLQLRSTFWWKDKASSWFALRHVGAVPTFNAQGGLTHIPAYLELDLHVTWQVRPDVELSVSGRNLLDRAHAELGALPDRREIPRSVQAMIRWGF